MGFDENVKVRQFLDSVGIVNDLAERDDCCDSTDECQKQFLLWIVESHQKTFQFNTKLLAQLLL